MKAIFTSVALLLVMALVAAPAAALSSCWTNAADAQRGCGPDCPMMAMNAHHAADKVQADTRGNSCCEISSGKTVPAIQLQAPTGRTAVAAPQSPGVLTAVLAAEPSDSPPSAPPLPVASPQAALCTFLI